MNGLDWRTTAEDVIQRVRPRSGPQILVESWRRCVRRIRNDEYVCQLLEEWGEEAGHVELILLSAHSLPGYRLSKRGLNRTQIYRAQRHGKVASNKKRCLTRFKTPKKNMKEEIERLIEKVQAARERLTAVQEYSTPADTTLPEVCDHLPLHASHWHCQCCILSFLP